MADDFDYDEFAADAAELIEEGGQAVTLTAYVAGTYSPATGSVTTTTTDQTGMGVETFYRASEIDGTLIKRGDKKLLLSPSNASGAALTQPSVGDTVTFSDLSVWRIENVEPIAPGGSVVVTTLQIRLLGQAAANDPGGTPIGLLLLITSPGSGSTPTVPSTAGQPLGALLLLTKAA